MPVQKQTRAGQRTRFKVNKASIGQVFMINCIRYTYITFKKLSKCVIIQVVIYFPFFQAFVAIGDHDGHVGLGVKCSKEVATAIRGAIILAKLTVIPVRRGYWGNKIGKPHTVPCKVKYLFKLLSAEYLF